MKIVNASYEILTEITGDELDRIEEIAKTCYKSEVSRDVEGTKNFIRGLIRRGHEAMLEHSLLSVKFICDRGISHELVRHRMASFAQESTRYCNYSKDKFGGELTFILPKYLQPGTKSFSLWVKAMGDAEDAYMAMLDEGLTAQEARGVLPNSLKTEIIMTANYREWRHFFILRAAEDTRRVHPQMKELAQRLLLDVDALIPVIFEDIAEVVRDRIRREVGMKDE